MGRIVIAVALVAVALLLGWPRGPAAPPSLPEMLREDPEPVYPANSPPVAKALDLLSTGDPAARKQAREAFAAAPDDVVAIFGLGWALHLDGNLAEAERQYLAAAALASRTGRRDIVYFSQHNLALIYQARGELEKSAAAFRAALGARRQIPDDWLQLGLTLDKLGRHGEAEKALDAAERLGGRRSD